MFQTAEQFFDAFDRAGFLVGAVWTPSTGGAPIMARVDLRSGESELLDDHSAFRYEIIFPATAFPGLLSAVDYGRIENITVEGIVYRVREVLQDDADGTLRATLQRY